MNKSISPYCLAVGSIAVAILAVSTATGIAATVLSDNFTGVTGGTLDANGWYFQNNSGAGTAWTTATDNTSPLSGNVLSNPAPGTSSNTVAYKQFASTTLATVGDSITVRLDFHVPASASGSFSVSLLGYSGTISTNSYGSDALSDANGYGYYQTVSGSAASPVYYEIVNNSPPPYATSLFTASQSTSVNDNLGHSFTLTLTKTAEGTQISPAIDSVIFDSFTDTAGSIYASFNTLRLTGSVGQAFNFDNITVSIVPEPSSFLILGLAFISLILVKRRVMRTSGNKVRTSFVPTILALSSLVGISLSSTARAGENISLMTTPVSDGALLDTRKVWERDPNQIADSEKIIQVGSFYGNLGVGILEFSLPPLDKLPGDKLVSAKLIVNTNAYTQTGEAADENSTANVDVDIYGYYGKNADGIVDYADWSGGEKLGRWLTENETVTGLGTPMPEFDVTAFVQAALQAKRPFVGLRLQPENVDETTRSFIVVRTAEFGSEKNCGPKLVLEFD